MWKLSGKWILLERSSCKCVTALFNKLPYLDFLGKANLDMRKEKALTDRDQLSLVVKYSF